MLKPTRWSMLVVLLVLGGGAQDVSAQARVVGLELVSSTRVGRTTFDYTYRVRVENGTPALDAAEARVTSRSLSTNILDGTVLLGTLAANASTTSIDTFVIRLPRTQRFDPADLTWSIVGTPIPPTVPSTAFTPATLSPAYAIVGTANPGTILVGQFGGWLLELEGSGPTATSGVGRLLSWSEAANRAIQWEIDRDGRLRMAPAADVTTTFVSDPCGVAGQREARIRVVEHVVTRESVGAAVDDVRVTTRTITEYPSTPGCPDRADEESERTDRRVGHEIGAGRRGEIPYAAAPSGSYSLQYYDPAFFVFNAWGSDVYPFHEEPSGPGTWSLTGGRLFVEQDSGPTEYVRLRQDGLLGDGVLAIATLSNGARVVSYGLSVLRDGSLDEFTDAGVVGLWRSGDDLSTPRDGGLELSQLYVRFNPAGTGRREFVSPLGTCQGVRAFTWTVPAGGGALFSSHPLFFGVPPQSRQWFPIARAGSRVYVIEYRVTPQPGGQPAFFLERTDFYELQSAPSACGRP